ncbi:hypothetical protein SAMN02745166_03674 [Prosthecobacter debontii]|uniref:Uncharacterized protein n=1 Tax=Prosthecobacter debontii TaxID=48467 RepID=A0A1T4YLW4_9BACT|nr:hypothetical protein [Prosthecobacter debontii]SKB02746.1 hypothetical protein SAMN02745166_03674 [Prosthecobacter debontii]
MTFISRGFLVALIGFCLAGISCSQIHTAGSLGYLINGDTQLRPTPTDYRHIAPRVQDVTPTPMQWGLDF